jgi:aminopeptidase
VTVHDRAWLEGQQMGLILGVANGSEEPPKFIEVHYKNTLGEVPPIILVGKGITFDSYVFFCSFILVSFI